MRASSLAILALISTAGWIVIVSAVHQAPTPHLARPQVRASEKASEALRACQESAKAASEEAAEALRACEQRLRHAEQLGADAGRNVVALQVLITVPPP